MTFSKHNATLVLLLQSITSYEPIIDERTRGDLKLAAVSGNKCLSGMFWKSFKNEASLADWNFRLPNPPDRTHITNLWEMKDERVLKRHPFSLDVIILLNLIFHFAVLDEIAFSLARRSWDFSSSTRNTTANRSAWGKWEVIFSAKETISNFHFLSRVCSNYTRAQCGCVKFSVIRKSTLITF